ncbi:uncharacterized protein PV07_01890 [Cladophialophora immunda]|uniref:Major facilitator superfamily (MFS) profile domain-containing protein n=1 Tax=Cladophialophora immunda TaxID=569365 RepID=A0A0D2A4D5_9EURO|nr:uncharacterized protein PV07_01890 [Cladophialophora immunda]KIW35176.1 hypothetical protein PV07_01890 [Cladophialophora immunda]
MADEKIEGSPPTIQTIEELNDPKKTGDTFGTEVEPGEAEPEEVEPVVTPRTWAVVFIMAMGYGLCFWPVPVFAAIGSQVAAAKGDPDKASWFVPAWTLSITVCFMICGANTDLLGRRWFLVGGNVICVIGHLVIGTAKTANTIIVGMSLAGFGGGNCQMAAFAVTELLPNRWRHIGVVLADIASLGAVTFAPVAGRFGWEEGTWRWNFYVAAILQGLSFVGLYLLYFPPAHPYNMQPKQLIKELDYLGMFLFTAGAVPLLMGIIWSGTYSSHDLHVVVPLVVGAVVLVVFALWETYGNIKHPLTPTYMFTSSHGRDLTAPCVALAIVNMSYYSSSILWPTMIVQFYTNGGAAWKHGIALSIVQGLAISAGALGLSLLGNKIRRWQWQLTGSMFVMVVFGALLALGKPSNQGLMVAFVFLSQAGYGWALYLSIAISQMGVAHKDLGHSGGISGVIRFAAGTISAAVYTTVLSNKVSTYTARYVPRAVTAAGLPTSQISALLNAINTPSLAQRFSPAVVAAAQQAVARAYEKGIQYVAYASIGFGVVGLVACALCKDVDDKMTNKIEVYMENTKYADRNRHEPTEKE